MATDDKEDTQQILNEYVEPLMEEDKVVWEKYLERRREFPDWTTEGLALLKIFSKEPKGNFLVIGIEEGGEQVSLNPMSYYFVNYEDAMEFGKAVMQKYEFVKKIVLAMAISVNEIKK